MRLPVIAVLTALVGTACGALLYTSAAPHADAHRASVASAPRAAVIAEGLNLLPSQTLRDWVTYGDHVVVARLDAEVDLPTSDEERAAGEGYIPRRLTFDIDDVLWSRPGAPSAPRRVDLGLDGSVFDATSVTPLRMEGQPVIEKAGSQYVMVLTHLPPSKLTSVPGWVALSPDSIIPIVDDVVRSSEDAEEHGVSPAVAALEGRQVWQVVRLLTSTTADPAAAPFMTRPPDERAQAVLREKRRSTGEKVERADGETP